MIVMYALDLMMGFPFGSGAGVCAALAIGAHWIGKLYRQ